MAIPGTCSRRAFYTLATARRAARACWRKDRSLRWVFQCLQCDMWHTTLSAEDPDAEGIMYATFAGRRRGAPRRDG